MKHLYHFNEALQIEPKFEALVKDEEVFKDILQEFDLSPKEINQDYIHLLPNKGRGNGFELILDIQMGNVIVKLGDKTVHNSSYFFVNNPKSNVFDRPGRFKEALPAALQFGAMGLMESSWRHNWDTFKPYWEQMIQGKIKYQPLLKGTKYTENNIQVGSFGDAAQKYHFLKNIHEHKPYILLDFQFLPASITLTEKEKEDINQLQKLAPGFL